MWETWVSNARLSIYHFAVFWSRSRLPQGPLPSIKEVAMDGHVHSCEVRRWFESGEYHETYTAANIDYRIIRLQKKRNFLWCESENMINTCYSVKENSQANAVNKSNLCSYRQPFSWNLGCYWGSTQRFPPRGAASPHFFSHGNVCFSVPRRVFQQVSGHPAASITLRRMLAGYPLPDSWSLGVGWRDEYERCTMESMNSQNIQYIQS